MRPTIDWSLSIAPAVTGNIQFLITPTQREVPGKHKMGPPEGGSVATPDSGSDIAFVAQLEGRMGRLIAHRLIISLPALLGVLFLCFCLLQVVPADPAIIIAGPEAKAETIAAIRKDLGLDQPIAVQFTGYIGRVAQGDLGRSIISNKMVIDELASTIGPTVELMLGA